jgi:hypothetical protein
LLCAVKFPHILHHIAPPSFTSVLQGVEWSASLPGRFILGYALDTRLGGPRGRSVSCGEKKNVCSCWEAQAVYCDNIGLDVQFISWPGCHSSYLGLGVIVHILAWMSQFISWPGLHSSYIDLDVTVHILAWMSEFHILAWMSQFLSWPGYHSSLTHFLLTESLAFWTLSIVRNFKC